MAYARRAPARSRSYGTRAKRSYSTKAIRRTAGTGRGKRAASGGGGQIVRIVIENQQPGAGRYPGVAARLETPTGRKAKY